MIKLVSTGAALLIAVTAVAAYPSMEFVKTDGTSEIIPSKGLTITSDGTNLILTNAYQHYQTIPMADVSYMQFSESVAASVEEVQATVEGEVSVYNASGVHVGNFSSASEAWENLGQGLYLVKDINGNSIKILVTK